MSGQSDEHKPARRVVWVRVLLLLPFICVLWVSSYDSLEPTLGGVPFFYWYQLLWVLLSAAIIALVYVVER